MSRVVNVTRKQVSLKSRMEVRECIHRFRHLLPPDCRLMSHFVPDKYWALAACSSTSCGREVFRSSEGLSAFNSQWVKDLACRGYDVQTCAEAATSPTFL